MNTEEFRRLPDRYVSKLLPPTARNLFVEAGAIPDENRRQLAIAGAEFASRQLYPHLFWNEIEILRMEKKWNDERIARERAALAKAFNKVTKGNAK